MAGVAGPESANNAASTGAFVPMLALGMPTGPVTAVLMAALLIHGVPPGPTLVNDHPNVFWGFVASMYVGNLMLLLLNLPLVGVFVNLLRIPYAYLYPLIIMFCVIGVYEVNHSIVDVWIMLIFGVVGYGLKKFGFDPAPLVLGLVIAPIFEMSLRQSLIMSDGTWAIFLERPIALVLLAVSAGLLALAAVSLVTRDWRGKLAEVETKPVKGESSASRPQALFLQALVHVGDVFAVAVEQQRRLALPLVPMISSVAWLQRGCATSGLTLAQKPYSDACSASQKVFGRWSVKLKRTIDLTDLKPYFHGAASRIGAPIDFATGLP